MVQEWERFNSWDELIDWASIDNNLNVNGSSNEESNFVNSFFEVFAEKSTYHLIPKSMGAILKKILINKQKEAN